ncbi:MAG TPA: hypothetical protein VM260_10635, partial [Pirellula sp.]|nr:hypothetical protein [Pirellula sp.]
EQIGQCLTWGAVCISIISQLRWAFKTWLQIRKRTTLHPNPALNSSGKELYLGLFFGEDPNGAIAWIALRNYLTSHAPIPTYLQTRLKTSGQLREKR